jgi:multiple sugar transport system ATP-binding protein
VARQSTRSGLHAGDRVGLEIDASATHVFDAQGRIARPALAA